MSHLKINLLPALTVLLFALSCSSSPVRYNRIEFKIPDHIKVKADDFKTAFGESGTDMSAAYSLEIILYSYSSGKETISFSGSNDINIVNGSGRLKALVKVMDGKKIIRAEFVESRGNSMEEMVSSLVKEIKYRMLDQQ